MTITSSQVFDGITAVATLGAAVAAAVSAYVSSKGANAAKEAVKEARLARKDELAPRLVLERDFLDFHFQWPHPSTLNGEPAFLARKNWKGNDPSPPTFSLTNHGVGPALELQLVFEFEDPNGSLLVPEQLESFGLSMHDEPESDVQPAFKTLTYQCQSGQGVGLPLYQRVTIDVSNCAPGQTRTIEFPQALLNRLFLRGLQSLDRGLDMQGIERLVLSVRIRCHTVEGEPYSTQFRFHALPFYFAEHDPIVVYGHFWELPMYPKNNDFRVI